jgi:hypothetical protein
MTGRASVAVDDGDGFVGVAKDRINECHAHGASADDQVICFDGFHGAVRVL